MNHYWLTYFYWVRKTSANFWSWINLHWSNTSITYCFILCILFIILYQGTLVTFPVTWRLIGTNVTCFVVTLLLLDSSSRYLIVMKRTRSPFHAMVSDRSTYGGLWAWPNHSVSCQPVDDLVWPNHHVYSIDFFMLHVHCV